MISKGSRLVNFLCFAPRVKLSFGDLLVIATAIDEKTDVVGIWTMVGKFFNGPFIGEALVMLSLWIIFIGEQSTFTSLLAMQGMPTNHMDYDGLYLLIEVELIP